MSLFVSNALSNLMKIRAETGRPKPKVSIWTIRYLAINENGLNVIDKTITTKKSMTKYKALYEFVKYLRNNSERLLYKNPDYKNEVTIEEKEINLFNYEQF